jgi:hypothetical protein
MTAEDLIQVQDRFSARCHDARMPFARLPAALFLLAIAQAGSAAEVVAGWLQSAGHCANLMDGRFRHMGIGVATGSKPGQIYWVQTLGAPGGG